MHAYVLFLGLTRVYAFNKKVLQYVGRRGGNNDFFFFLGCINTTRYMHVFLFHFVPFFPQLSNGSALMSGTRDSALYR